MDEPILLGSASRGCVRHSAVAWGCAPCVALAGQRHQQVAVAELRSPLRAAWGGGI